ncbi:MAG: hypothetical protein A3C85_04610 [Candidatus Doudnabacteria bacterium RIFCSPHIGHO2_02_FULL_48_21]|uniref:Uncharacterized protein n=1 Tax=Candidatus Doudnabacteria bacterium RIFCSPLOWO2_02_FULL_48_13 TaxID=1817845 RepID=A0A1F5QCG2_9BACT|nr:MAG: hypothetical protein A3K05_00455 [Candidatus Doudnabacteria bacterium RIFCSPHIGHO2_01_48_18]OGE79695.1 MAG: hypothetical protein A2668_01195 [Candidatus Doudnabacteria bacterium RIFCSPHIGHO2_01_FULL_48_180]OGE91496.1 MAG: hypothetical protein A3F44_01395 [Candidatus Doudnabacteria bacterium RIFCSPHIGHO2_12_FULL_47_25]OGE93110.1 MAG: hypothetical protein A3C85_04610 [Candidatus Doudnabacteria bacterium RIFCSPHIGHO2_02_FULL_48_21]OGE98117.1 MAG: hypothetical protein A3A83_02570 [Candidatu
MIDPTLTSYVKQNLKDGFSQNEIMGALRSAGWHEADIEGAFHQTAPSQNTAAEDLALDLTDLPDQGSFFSRHRTAVIALFIFLIFAPIVGYAGFLAWQRYAAPQTTDESVTPPPSPLNKGEVPIVNTAAIARDEQRLKDIQLLQDSLNAFLAAKKVYPKALAELTAEKFLEQLPADPDTGADYLYLPLGEPVLDYTLSFVLETDMGTLEAGLHETAPANPLQAQTITEQDQAVKGISVKSRSSKIAVTDLSATPFYPGEEVSVAVQTTLRLKEVILLTDHLKLSDKNQPFDFRFTGPKTPGEYEVRIFAFTESGETLFQTTTLTVKP